jgi:hypothetical protein
MTGPEQALEVLVAGAECVGAWEFPNRKDVLLAKASPDKDKPQRAAPVWVSREDRPQLSGRPAAP